MVKHLKSVKYLNEIGRACERYILVDFLQLLNRNKMDELMNLEIITVDVIYTVTKNILTSAIN